MNFSTTDFTVFAIYILAMIGFGVYLAFKEKNDTAESYFLASKTLPWWAIGGSLIASNISAEQMIGMSGSGYAIGLAIASYEFMAAATLLVVGKYLLPVFLEHNIQTMPQFLEKRFDGRVRTGLAIFWVILFVFVNVGSLYYLGSLALHSIMGIPLHYAVIGLMIYSGTLSVFGGLKAVVWTDVIQVIILILGGAIASILVLNAVSDGQGVVEGIKMLYEKAPEKFNMIFDKSDTYIDIETGKTKSAYQLLPGLGVLIGGMWIANLYYWGFNQYIIQRALAAKDIRESQKGVVTAAIIKMFVPFIVVLPGIAAYVMKADITKADQAYPWVVNSFVTSGFKGIVVAALVAAIGSSICSMVNSASTIYTLDIHNKFFNKDGSEASQVRTGRLASLGALIIGALMVPALKNYDQIFQFIQEYTGFISPGILVVFLFGLFWKRTTTNAALAVVVLSLPLSWGLKELSEGISFMYQDRHYLISVGEIPFIHRMGISFLVLSATIIGISMMESKTDSPKAIELRKGLFDTDKT
ncbi:MAG: sodium/solute symporter, partial [Saprospiraceae bacterium]|nr:sodium/solute symporter [Saprospiraceae bacterium]